MGEVWDLTFCRSEPHILEVQSECRDRFPFTCDAMKAIQVLEFSFANGGAFLIITNELFVRMLSPATSSRRLKWKDWARWTTLWGQELGRLSESVNFA